MKKLCYVATIPAVVHAFLRPHIQAASEKYEVTVICSAVDKELLVGLNARLIFLCIERKPAPWKDLLVLFQMIVIFRREKFDIVHSHMPKTGLLGMLAAKFVGIPIRMNTSHGEVWATRKGWRRWLLKRFDQLVGVLATNSLLVSQSQRNFLVSEKVLPQGKAEVIASGSICGVDVLRFHPNSEVRDTIRLALGIADNAKVILFVGRLNRDKGMLDLAEAFVQIAQQNAEVELLLVGAEEDVPFVLIKKICHAYLNRLHYLSFTATPERYMAAADIFCLPSYREGFGLTLIEAAACGVPAVASRIYGITDAVVENQTGLLFPVGDVLALIQALQRILEDNELRVSLGNAARARAVEQFSSVIMTHEMLNLYDKLSKNC